ncbi:MAG: DUF1573 domain-containing protein, partial [bacterium]|nr:DUF1573 domain-containing protein [bacterium]
MRRGWCMAVGALLVGSRSLAWVGPRFEWLAPTNRMWGPYYGFPLVVVTSRFRNAGGTVLRVGNERSTCVCTKLSKPPEELQPGEVGEIIMTVEQEPTVFPTQRGFGYVMTTSDPDNPVVGWSGVAEFEPTNVPAKMAGGGSARA